MIDVNETELTEENYEMFMIALDIEFERQYPKAGLNEYSKTLSKEDWLKEYLGATIQNVIDGEVECWEE